MTQLLDFSIKVKNFKCFGEVAQGFETIKPVNLIIGRNNSGKSSLLDIIEYATKEKIEVPAGLWHSHKQPEFIAEAALTDAVIKSAFPENTHGGIIPGRNHYEFGRRLIGARLVWRLHVSRGQKFLHLGPSPDGSYPLNAIQQDKQKYLENIAHAMANPFAGKQFKRIHAERNIRPEVDSQADLNVDGDGRGATNIIQNFINKFSLPSDLVEKTLLNELNLIFGPDAHFKDIVCQQIESGAWEIYIEEETKGRIPLSQSGSGLKTIILVLIYIHLLPIVAKKNLEFFVFAFEELENNLHPSLLRRVLTYLRTQAHEHKCIFFLTTHSNVAIDLFSKDEGAQILHVTHDGTTATSRAAKTYVDNKGILDDLDVRASDLLQSNGIIWVEGPSDRIYLNRWINLWSNGTLSEGNHYQCVFYGGRLLAHLSSHESDVIQEGVSLLRVNRNSAIVIDSDKRNQQTRLNETKQRVAKEISSNGGLAWITKGREIENYLSAEIVARWLKLDANSVKQIGQYDHFSSYLCSLDKEKGPRYASHKPLSAEELVPYMTHANITGILDLSERLDELCSTIRQWNNLKSSKAR